MTNQIKWKKLLRINKIYDKSKERINKIKAVILSFKINESRYIALFVVSESLTNLLSIDYANIDLFSIFFSINFARWKSVGLSHIAYIVIY